MNTSKKGDELRDAVYTIIKAAKKRNCSREKLLSGTAVDVYFEDTMPFHAKPIKYGVECKNYEKSIDRTRFSSIYATYHPAIQAGYIDRLLVITKRATPSNVLTSLNDHEWIVVNTFDEFYTNFLDFRAYLYSLISGWNDDGLNSYYVSSNDQDGNSIDGTINAWIDSEDFRPRAILAGYGMGKTSYAKYVAYSFAKRWLDGKVRRIPILLRLGDIYSEQSLEGLVCKYFASQNFVPGFSFELFKEFNRQGLFLIILDGFDEMKFAMTFSSFSRNIKEFNQLICGKSKVIILGRPNAFTSEDERNSVLHGIKKIGDEEIRDASLPDYRELEIMPFDRDQVNQFIPKYLDYQYRCGSARDNSFVNEQFCRQRAADLLDARFSELIARPVHARMLATIALSTQVELSEFSRYDLYNHFIDLFLERENSRIARREIDSDKRKDFISQVAWDRWLKDGTRGFTFDDLEKVKWQYDIDNVSRKAVLRDLIIGSVLESKGDYYFFSHRSFQEFLVAEYLVTGQWGIKNLLDIDRALGDGVKEFLKDNPDRMQMFLDRLRENLQISLGPVSLSLLDFLSENCEPLSVNVISGRVGWNNPWEAISCTLSAPNLFDSQCIGEQWPLIAEVLDADHLKAFIIGILIRAHREAGRLTSNQAISLTGILHSLNLRTIKNVIIHKNRINDFAVNDLERRGWLEVLLSAISPSFNDMAELTHLEFNANSLLTALVRNASTGFTLEAALPEVPEHEAANIKVAISQLDIGLRHRYRERKLKPGKTADLQKVGREGREDRQKIIKFWRAKPDLRSAVKVESRTDTSVRSRRDILTLPQ